MRAQPRWPIVLGFLHAPLGSPAAARPQLSRSTARSETAGPCMHGPVRSRRDVLPLSGAAARSSAALGRNAPSAWPAPGPHRLVTLPGPGRPRKSPEGRRETRVSPNSSCLFFCRTRPLFCVEFVLYIMPNPSGCFVRIRGDCMGTCPLCAKQASPPGGGSRSLALRVRDDVPVQGGRASTPSGLGKGALSRSAQSKPLLPLSGPPGRATEFSVATALRLDSAMTSCFYAAHTRPSQPPVRRTGPTVCHLRPGPRPGPRGPAPRPGPLRLPLRSLSRNLKDPLGIVPASRWHAPLTGDLLSAPSQR